MQRVPWQDRQLKLNGYKKGGPGVLYAVGYPELRQCRLRAPLLLITPSGCLQPSLASAMSLSTGEIAGAGKSLSARTGVEVGAETHVGCEVSEHPILGVPWCVFLN